MIIKTSAIYRAKISNGIMLENDATGEGFKSLFKGVVLELKTEYGHMCYFTTGTADISYGVLTEVYQGSRIKSSYIELRKIAEVRVTSIDRKTFTTIQKVRG